jgi:hypothetical protein
VTRKTKRMMVSFFVRHPCFWFRFPNSKHPWHPFAQSFRHRLLSFFVFAGPNADLISFHPETAKIHDWRHKLQKAFLSKTVPTLKVCLTFYHFLFLFLRLALSDFCLYPLAYGHYHCRRCIVRFSSVVFSYRTLLIKVVSFFKSSNVTFFDFYCISVFSLHIFALPSPHPVWRATPVVVAIIGHFFTAFPPLFPLLCPFPPFYHPTPPVLTFLSSSPFPLPIHPCSPVFPQPFFLPTSHPNSEFCSFVITRLTPSKQDTPSLDELFTIVESYKHMSVPYLQFSKIGKVMQHIAVLKDDKVPGGRPI